MCYCDSIFYSQFVSQQSLGFGEPKNQQLETWFHVLRTIEEDIWIPWNPFGNIWKSTFFWWQVSLLIHFS